MKIRIKIESNNNLLLTILESSVFNRVDIRDLINNLKNRENNKENLTESDYNLIVTSIIPYYISYTRGWISGPEVWNNDPSTARKKTDFVWFKINGHGINYPNMPVGFPLPTHLYEGKKRWVQSWANLMKDQVFNECEGLALNGKIWVICNIGFEFCIFRFDLSRFSYPYASDTFDHFEPLNLNNWTEQQFDSKKIKYISESISPTQDLIRVIQWRLDKPEHYQWIHDMLRYIANNPV